VQVVPKPLVALVMLVCAAVAVDVADAIAD